MSVRQLTEAEAIEFAQSGAWEQLSHRDRAIFQLQQKKLCMPFSEFHKAIEVALNRPVFTHEFGLNWAGLLAEALGDQAAPTFDEIVGLIPAEKLCVVMLPAQTREADS